MLHRESFDKALVHVQHKYDPIHHLQIPNLIDINYKYISQTLLKNRKTTTSADPPTETEEKTYSQRTWRMGRPLTRDWFLLGDIHKK